MENNRLVNEVFVTINAIIIVEIVVRNRKFLFFNTFLVKMLGVLLLLL